MCLCQSYLKWCVLFSWDQKNTWNIAWARNYSSDPCPFLVNFFFLSPFLPQVLYWLLVSKHLARVNIFFVFVLKVEEIWFGFLDLCTLLQPCIVTQDIRVSTYTLAIKVQNSEALKTAGSWKCNVSLAIFKDSWQRDFNTIQCHTLEEKLNFAENTKVQLPISVDKQNCQGNGLTSTE